MLKTIMLGAAAAMVGGVGLGAVAFAWDLFGFEKQIREAVQRELSRAVVVCTIDDVVARSPQSTKPRNNLNGIEVFFENDDCGGDLPAQDYHPVLNTLLICGGMDNFEVLRLPDASGVIKEGVAVYGTRMPLCTDHNSIVRVSYVRTMK